MCTYAKFTFNIFFRENLVTLKYIYAWICKRIRITWKKKTKQKKKQNSKRIIKSIFQCPFSFIQCYLGVENCKEKACIHKQYLVWVWVCTRNNNIKPNNFQLFPKTPLKNNKFYLMLRGTLLLCYVLSSLAWFHVLVSHFLSQ